jgi:hypothetical protein
MVSGAILGALFGTLLAFIAGTIFGFCIGAIFGAALGFIDGMVLNCITGFFYAAPKSASIYPGLIYSVAIIINTVPFFIFLGGLVLSWAAMPLSIGQAATSILCSSGIPAFLAGAATAYFCGGYLEYVDSLLKDTPTRNVPMNVLS